MSNTDKHYRVFLFHWDTWEIALDASSKEAAESQARAIFDEQGEAAFKHFDCGVDGVEAEYAGPAEGGDE